MATQHCVDLERSFTMSWPGYCIHDPTCGSDSDCITRLEIDELNGYDSDEEEEYDEFDDPEFWEKGE